MTEKLVNIYKLGHCTQYVPIHMDVIQYQEYQPLPPYSNRVGAIPLDGTVEIKIEPIHRLCKVNKQGKEDTYISIDPSLKEYLIDIYETPLRAIISKQSQQLNSNTESFKQIAKDLRSFWAMPWWKRIYKVLVRKEYD